MRIALYEPDIPQNTGTILRLAACLGIEAHIVEPAGFPTTDRAFRRAGMDYLGEAGGQAGGFPTHSNNYGLVDTAG